ncbi:MAG: hypothetical protein HOO96_42845 [Polyangiaceae bacterium]|nr:hypothetical protein [Polyangiaceae bacterium]
MSVSFDLIFSGSHRSPSPVPRRNPFTGQDVEVYTYTLSEKELRDAKAVLSSHKASDDGDRHHVIQLADGVRMEVTVGSKQDGEQGTWGVMFRILSPDAMKFLYELASAGKFLVQSDDASVATSEAAKNSAKARGNDFDAKCAVAKSPEEMGVLLKDGFEAWKAYAQQVTNK